MKVLEAIKNSKCFVVTRNGGILAINNGSGINFGLNKKISEKEMLDMDIIEVQKVEGLIADYTCIRV